MYINNKPFTETLQMAQRDMYDIHTLLLQPLKKQQKITKRRKITWYVVSGAEHAIAVTFGVLAAVDFYNQRYAMGGFNMVLLTIGAAAGFHANNIAKSYTDADKQLKEKIHDIQTAVNCALPEKLHEIAEVARQTQHR